MQSDLHKLKNLGNTSINWLKAVGINSLEDLHTIGEVEAYCRIKQRGIRVSKVLLYALHGALCDTHWTELPQDIKDRLVESAAQCCKEDTIDHA